MITNLGKGTILLLASVGLFLVADMYQSVKTSQEITLENKHKIAIMQIEARQAFIKQDETLSTIKNKVISMQGKHDELISNMFYLEKNVAYFSGMTPSEEKPRAVLITLRNSEGVDVSVEGNLIKLQDRRKHESAGSKSPIAPR